MAGRRMVAAFAAAPAALQTGSTIRETLHDSQAHYRAAVYTLQTMQLDTACLFADMSLEAEACGCGVQFTDDKLPSITTHPVSTIDSLKTLAVPDPKRSGRMPVFLETMRLLGRNLIVIKIAEVSGPFTLAATLGGTGIYGDVRKDPGKVETLLRYCEKVIIGYARSLVNAGADMILVAEPSGSQLSAPAYERFSLPFTRNIIRSVKVQCILHICGKAGHLIEKMCTSGAAALSIDDVNLPEILDIVPRNIVIIGNISPARFYTDSPAEIEARTLNLLEAVKKRREFLAAPGCDLAPLTPPQNIQAFARTVKTYHRA